MYSYRLKITDTSHCNNPGLFFLCMATIVFYIFVFLYDNFSVCIQ